MKKILLPLCVLMFLAGCRSTDTHSAGGEQFAIQRETEDDRKVAALVDGSITVKVSEEPSVSKPVEEPSSSVIQLVESDLGFAEIQAHVTPVGRRTLVEVLADTKSGSVTIDLTIDIPESVRYNISSTHDQLPGFGGLQFTREGDDDIEAACGRLKPGRFRINGSYKVAEGVCAQYEWTLELHRSFDIPPPPTPQQPVPVPRP